MKQHISKHNSRRLWAIALSAAGLVATASGQKREWAEAPLAVTLNPTGAQNHWLIWGARLSVDVEGVQAYVRISNRSAKPFHSARFYGEYYDESGRLCFTAAFSQDVNLGDARGAFGPGETRELYSNSSVAPAVKPASLTLWFLGEAEQQPEVREIHAPPTVSNGVNESLTIPSDPNVSQPQDKLTPYSLVEVIVDQKGFGASIRVVASAGATAAEWAQKLASTLRFMPAIRGGTEAGGVTTVLLFRLLDVALPSDTPAGAPWEDPWVRSYLAASGTSVLPVVQLLELRRFKRSEPFEYLDLGTWWSLPVFASVPNPTKTGSRLWWAPAEGGQRRR